MERDQEKHLSPNYIYPNYIYPTEIAVGWLKVLKCCNATLAICSLSAVPDIVNLRILLQVF